MTAPLSRAMALPMRDEWRKWGFLGLTLLALGMGYAATVGEMIHVWHTSETYAHGFLIAPIALWLLHRQRAELLATPWQPAPLALPALMLAGLLWLASGLGAVDVLQQLALVGLVVGALWFLLGTPWLRAAWFPCTFLILAVPLGDGLTPFLIDHTANFVVAALRVVGVPVYREGSFFVIPSGNWSVVSGCSGMRYLMATITVASLFAHLNYRAVWKQGLFVLLAIAVAIVANWFRAFGIVMIAHLSDMKLALGVDHYLYGWVFFGIIIFLLMSVGGLWRDEDAALSQVAVVPGVARPWQCSAGKLALLLSTLLIWPLLAQQLAHIPVHPLARVGPDTTLAPGSGAAFEVAGWTPHYVGNPEQDSGEVTVGSTRCGWQLAWYPQQGPGSEIIAAGNRLVQEKLDPWRVLSLDVGSTTVAAVPAVKQTVLQERAGERVTLVWQWYWVDGSVTSNPLITQWLGLRGRLRGHGNAGASVLVYQLLDDAVQVPAAIPTANACVAHVAPILQARFAHSLSAARTPP